MLSIKDRVVELDGQAAALVDFRQAYPAFDVAEVEALRAAEYSRLDHLDQVYLDYTGGGLYAESQLRRHMELLSRNVFGNPHSANPTSLASTRVDEHARAYVLEYFRASPAEYAVIFTANASGALKLVGESYPFGPDAHYLLTFDNHNSVNGIREFARRQGARFTYVPVVPPDLRADEAQLMALLDQADPAYPNLFAYPAQSNFSGVQHPLEWIEMARGRGWDVLVDGAAFAPTNRLDLSVWQPDFVPLSFYKMFGYPTGIGCLIARRAALKKLHRPWFAGGTITLASVQADGYFLAEGEAGFEDGTINYLGLPAVEAGLKHLETIGMDTLHDRVMALTGWLLGQLVALRHTNGAPLVRIFGPLDTDRRGGTITLNMYDPHGNLVDFRRIESLANTANISLRTGCFCNPGAGEVAGGLTREDFRDCFKNEERMTFEQFIMAMDSKHPGAVRVSLGIASNFTDAYRFVQFARTFLDRSAGSI